MPDFKPEWVEVHAGKTDQQKALTGLLSPPAAVGAIVDNASP